MRYVDLGSAPYNTQKRKNRGGFRPILFLSLPIISLMVFGIVFSKGGFSLLLKPFSVFSKVGSGPKLEESYGVTSILLLGLDKRESNKAGNGVLADTIMVVSVKPRDRKVVVLSIPRDLWVPLGDTTYGKINSAYSLGGVDLTREVVSNVLDIPIHYWVVVDFDGVRKAIDSLGGIDVYVERSFDDYGFPREGYEDAWPESERWEHIHFEQGLTHMDGEMALKYARSRHALGPEGSDFARARRQQQVLLAAKERALSLSTLIDPIKIKELLGSFGSSVSTNVNVFEAQYFFELARQVDSEGVVSEVLDRGSDGFLYTPEDIEPYGGAWVLVPKVGDFSEVHRWVQKLLFGD